MWLGSLSVGVLGNRHLRGLWVITRGLKGAAGLSLEFGSSFGWGVAAGLRALYRVATVMIALRQGTSAGGREAGFVSRRDSVDEAIILTGNTAGPDRAERDMMGCFDSACFRGSEAAGRSIPRAMIFAGGFPNSFG